MHSRAHFIAFSSFLVALAGCGAGSPGVPAPDLTGNWQIQTSSTTPPPSGFLLLGALSSQGSSVTGTFRFDDLQQPLACGNFNEVVTVSGSIDASRNLILTSASFAGDATLKIQLNIPAQPTSFASGTIEITGTSCNSPSSPAIAVEFAPLTGTFAGTVEPGTIANPGTTGGGPVSITLTQSSTPQPDGQFPLTGKMDYTLGTCTQTVALTGTASGIGVNLTTTPTLGSDSVNLLATALPTGTQLSAAELLFLSGTCPASPGLPTTYSGILTRQ
jgi:hypothetical protein